MRRFGQVNRDRVWYKVSRAILLCCLAAGIAAQAQTLTTLTSFSGTTSYSPCALIRGNDGNFYGASGGTAPNLDALFNIFQITPAGTVTYVVYGAVSFQATSLLQGSDGSFYGTSKDGGNTNGMIFKATPGKALVVSHQFVGTDGASPVGGMVQATDGNFYGTTAAGGNGATAANFYIGPGVIFRTTPSGSFSVIYMFSGSDGYSPNGNLIQATDGNLYGTTESGGEGCNASAAYMPSGCGTVFRISTAGTLTTLHLFIAAVDGSAPLTGLVQAADGNLYGTTSAGGPNGYGTVFRITTAGAFTTLHSFTGTDGAVPNGATPMVQATDGNFYGTTYGQGKHGKTGQPNQGTIFKMTPSGTLTTLYSFCAQTNCADGAYPNSLVQGSDGNFYGTTAEGGANGAGTVFELSLVSPTLPTIATTGGVLNGASFQPGIAANSWFSIIGTNLAPQTDNWNNSIVDGNLPEGLDGVKVSVGGQPAYIAYISSTQINGIAPNVVAASLPVTVTTPSGVSSAVTTDLAQFQPAFFAWGNYAVATKLDYSYAVKNGTFPNLTTTPAQPGQVIVLWGTGFGPTTPSAPPGAVTPSTDIYSTANPVTITVGGISATVLGAALTPGFAGLYQVAIQVPSLSNGDYPVVASVGGVQSPATTLLTVQQ